jgi:hypothetical protein
VDNFIRVNIELSEQGILFTQPKLIQCMLNTLGLVDKDKEKDIPELSSKLLKIYLSSEPHNEDWNCPSVQRILIYLEKSTRRDIAYVVHQCAGFSSQPRMQDIKAAKQISEYKYNQTRNHSNLMLMHILLEVGNG